MSKKAELTFDHVALRVRDVEKSVAWYQEKVHASVEYQDETWAMLLIGGAKVALVTEGQHPSHIAFKVPSPDELPCRSEETSEHRDGTQFFCAGDPDGNTIEWVYYPPGLEREISNDPIDW